MELEEPSIRLGKKTIKRDGSDVYIIAEIGQNHQGNLNTAKEMILAAKGAGCDCVKFQKSELTAKFTKTALDRIYDSSNSWGITYGEHKRHLEFSMEQFKELQAFCDENKIDFTASAMDEVSLEQLAEIGVPFIKIGSGDTNNFPLLSKAAALPVPLVISTGMQEMSVIERVVEIVRSEEAESGSCNFALLHCVSAYPTNAADATLSLVTLLRERFPGCVIGYSGHENVSVKLSLAAILLGARIIERHFTLDKQWKGSDHQCSLDPAELAQLVAAVRDLTIKGFLNRATPYGRHEIIELLGSDESLLLALKAVSGKMVLPCELSCKRKLGKSVVAARPLQRGQVLRAVGDVCIKVSEPNGMPADCFPAAIVGATLQRDIAIDEPLQWADIENK